MFSFDGRSPEIYDVMRKNPKAYEKKMEGLRNAVEHGKNKITLMTCVADQVNAEHMPDLIEMCHEYRHRIDALDLIPLTATGSAEEVDIESADTEDVERIMREAVPGMEFFPAALALEIKTLHDVYESDRITFGGAHPNCESISLLISDGRKYHPPSEFLKQPFMDVVNNLRKLDEKMADKINNSLTARLFGKPGQKFLYGKALFMFVRRNADLKKIFGGSPTGKTLKILWGLIRGTKMKHLLRQHTRCHHILRVMVLPFEEPECLEAARLVDCPAAFAFEHPETKNIRFMPVCSWPMYKNDILRTTAENHGIADESAGNLGMENLSAQSDSKQTDHAAKQ